MQEDIKLLVQLQEIDSVIIKKKAIIDLLPTKLLAAEQSLKDVQLLYDKERQKCEQLEKKKKEKERAVEDINGKIDKIKIRSSEIKNNKEYQAHLKEIETFDKERYAMEDEIISLMEAVEAANKDMKAADLKVKAEKDKVEAFKKEVEKEIAEAEKDLSLHKSKRADLTKTIDTDIYNEYMTIFKAGRGIAVIEARDEICQGCNMNIPPQMFVEIKKDKDSEVIRCPQCRRILYWVEKND
ncbi:MAG: hypothetical protein HY755_04850 [Nitrospirae bacterium]|nr:hypothetical protein [Nitrospirota bacterium]